MAITPAGVNELRPPRPRGLRRGRGRRWLLDHRRRVRRGRGEDPAGPPTTSGPTGDLILKVKEPIAEEYHRMRAGPGALHLPAPGRVQGRAPTRCSTARSPASPTRPSSCPTARCRCSRRCREVAGRLAPQVGSYHLMRSGGGRGVLMGGVPGRVRGQGRGHRRRRVRHERGRDRARHAGRGAAAGQEHRPAAGGRRRLPRAPADRRLQRLRDREGRCSTPTWSSARCWCPGPRRRR